MDKSSYAAGNLFGIHGRTALITGATSGIGYMMAEGLVVNGIGTLFITSIDGEEFVAGKVESLKGLAAQHGHNTAIFGSVSLSSS